MAYVGANTSYLVNNVDIGNSVITKEYLIDLYPSLVDNFRFAGLWTWGYGGNGDLGNNATGNVGSPVQTIAAGANWKQVASGGGTCLGIKTDGTLWTWGYGGLGNLGDNTAVSKSSPVQTISAGTNWKTGGGGYYHVAAVKTDGTLWAWGAGDIGQLGNNALTNRSSPVQTISGGTNWKQVSCSISTTTTLNFTSAIKTDGTLWVWGYGTSGAMGNNATTSRSSPVQTISGGTNWKQVACGGGHIGAIKTDGTLWLWGSGNNGELGQNFLGNASSPVQTVAAGTNWTQVACGGTHTAAIKTDGTLWTWGVGTSGQLGNNTIVGKSSPVQTIAAGTNWKQVSAGTSDSAAIKTDGTLWVWGFDQSGYGTIGDNTFVPKSSPVQTIAGGTNWKQVVITEAGCRAIRDNSADIFGNSL